MNLEELLADPSAPPVRIAVTGANGGYARTLLSQLRAIDAIEVAALCDLDTDRVRDLWAEIGHTEGLVAVGQGAPGATVLTDDLDRLLDVSFDVLVEATGNPARGYAAARAALDAGRHVVMVSKEVDSVAAADLLGAAERAGVGYTLAGGDQPANLIALVSAVRLLGLDVVAVGKSSEYDLVYDPRTGVLTQLDEHVDAPGLAGLLELGADTADTLDRRDAAVAALHRSATADYCEMAVVAANAGFRPDAERLRYPVARPAELADIYAPCEDGGILDGTGRIDVFSALRLPGEASFAGGVFAVVRTTDPVTWATIAQKGHVVSRNGKYACLYLPYHYMGVETPLTILALARAGLSTGYRRMRGDVVLAGRARGPIPAGTTLAMGGHHHDVEGVDPVLVRRSEVGDDVAPLYLASFATTVGSLAPGALLRLGDLTGIDPALAAAARAGA
ncbi:putative homoserine dehydrogenase-like protein [Murinocardiopsis flavida]|uniref:Putative homoserine dehydrogenase-like protein n=1 Tax=Murinocardiopsis flavida TaxID=645275 RepID=A0A2P8CJ82_9ACTN|nr:homoserine dehydrogenase [Murinocardiopsis flavida]PSK85026.1 putative homoserine dehydrogenase-like protein [Murinocardiopsis flavida]